MEIEYTDQIPVPKEELLRFLKEHCFQSNEQQMSNKTWFHPSAAKQTQHQPLIVKSNRQVSKDSSVL